MFAVGTGISPHVRELGPDLVDQELLLLSFSDGKGSLQNVVYRNDSQESGQVAAATGSQLTSELILHHCYNRADTVLFGRHYLFNQQTSTLKVGGDESFLANVGGKFVA